MANRIVIVVLVVLLLVAAPLWPWSRGWTWAPAGILGIGLGTLLLFQFSVLPEA